MSVQGQKFKWEKPKGPGWLRKVIESLFDAVNKTQPIAGIGVDIDQTDKGRQISASVGVGGKKGTSTPFPFAVTSASTETDPPKAALKVAPGKLATVVPGINSADVGEDENLVPLTNDPPPLYIAFGEPFSLFLKVTIDTTDPALQFRSHIKKIQVVSDNDEDVVADIDPETNEVKEMTVKWVDDEGEPDDSQKNKGSFYVKLADITGALVEGDIVVNKITQWLFNNYVTFVIAGDEAIILY